MGPARLAHVLDAAFMGANRGASETMAGAQESGQATDRAAKATLLRTRSRTDSTPLEKTSKRERTT